MRTALPLGGRRPGDQRCQGVIRRRARPVDRDQLLALQEPDLDVGGGRRRKGEQGRQDDQDLGKPPHRSTTVAAVGRMRLRSNPRTLRISRRARRRLLTLPVGVAAGRGGTARRGGRALPGRELQRRPRVGTAGGGSGVASPVARRRRATQACPPPIIRRLRTSRGSSAGRRPGQGHRRVVGDQLQRDREQDRVELGLGSGPRSSRRPAVERRVGQREDRAAAGFTCSTAARSSRTARRRAPARTSAPRRDQRQRPVLLLRGRVGLAWTYETSFSFWAPSRATGSPAPRR